MFRGPIADEPTKLTGLQLSVDAAALRQLGGKAVTAESVVVAEAMFRLQGAARLG